MKLDLKWWETHIMSECRKIDKGNPDVVIQTDSSTQGWGYSFNNQTGGGRWSREELNSHINVAKDIWNFCILHGIWLSIAHIPGKSNKADRPSREFN